MHASTMGFSGNTPYISGLDCTWFSHCIASGVSFLKVATVLEILMTGYDFGTHSAAEPYEMGQDLAAMMLSFTVWRHAGSLL